MRSHLRRQLHRHLPTIFLTIVITSLISSSVFLILKLVHSPTPLAFHHSLFDSSYSATIPGINMTTSLTATKDHAQVQVSRENSTLTFAIPLTNSQITGSGESVSYSAPKNGLKLDYQLTPRGLKESIIFASAPTSTIHNLPSTISMKNLVVKVTPEGIPVFYDGSGTYQFNFEAPYAVDAKGAVSHAFSYRLVPVSQKPLIPRLLMGGAKSLPTNSYTLELTLDSAWLADPKRVYPVTIDPTVVHNTSATFATGTENRVTDTGSGSSPNLTTYYEELPADQETVGLWHLNEASGNALDASGNGNTGTPTGTTIVSGLMGNARSFNGTSDNISLAASTNANVTGDISVELWINPTSFSANSSPIHKDSQYSFQINTSGYVSWADSSNWSYANFGATNIGLVTGQWQHLAFTKTGGVVNIYLNGILKASKAFGSSLTSTANVMHIGCYYSGSACSAYFNGSIDELRISNIARSADEIRMDASRRPYSVYTSPLVDLTYPIHSWNSLSWSELGVNTGDGETLSNSTSLVAQWNFNATTSTATATNDAGSCGASCNGTLTSFTNTTGQDVLAGSGWTVNNKRWGAGALMFNGSNNYVSVGTNPMSGTGSFSLESWVKTSSTGVRKEIISIGNNIATNDLATLFINANNKLEADLTNVGGPTSAVTITDGNWHHVAVVNTSGSMQLYVDGSASGAAVSMSPNLGSNSINIGKLVNYAGYYFNGVIDSTRIYSRALTASEILSNYNVGNLELQTRVGSSADPNDGTWEAWKPVTSETAIDNMDNPLDYATPSASIVTGALVATSSAATPLMEGTHSLQIKTGQVTSMTSTVGMWHLDETGGTGAYITDSSGNGNNGTPTGTTVVNGIAGKARKFNSDTDKIITGSTSILNTDTHTIEFWIKFNQNTDANWRQILDYRPAGTDRSPGIWNNPSNNCIHWRYDPGNTGGTSCGGPNGENTYYTVGQWYHIAGVKSGSVFSFYVNGALTETNTVVATKTAGNASVELGQGGSSAAYITLDEVSISNVARSPEEIAESYRLGRDHYINKTIAATDLSGKTSLPFYVAADRPGTYLAATIGNNAFANYQPDGNTVGLWHLDDDPAPIGSNPNMAGKSCSSLKLDGIITSGTYWIKPGTTAYQAYCDMTYDTYGWTRLNNNIASSTVAFNGSDNIITNNVPGACGSPGIAYTVSGVAVPWTDVRDVFVRTTTVQQCASINTGSGSYWNGSSWISYTMCAWNNRPWANSNSTDFTGLAYTWKIEGTKPASNQVQFNTQCTYADDTGSFTSTIYVKDTAATPDFFPVSQKDSSGYANNGNLIGTTFTQGKIGKGRNFNGTSDYISTPTTNFPTTNITVDFWAYPRAAASTSVINAATDDGTNRLNIHFPWSDNNIYWDFGNTSSGGRLSTAFNSSWFNTWAHYAFVSQSGVGMSIYRNGTLIASSATSSTFNPAGKTLNIALYPGPTYWNGMLDEVRISNVARSASDIRASYEVGARTHTVTIDFAATLNSGNLITGSSDLGFTVDATQYGASSMGSNLYLGDKIIVRENYNGTTYIVQGTVNSVNVSTGAVTVAAWDAGSTFPASGFTVNASVFKWQREYFDLSGSLSSQRNAVTNLTLRLTNGNEGRTIWLDDLRSTGGYLTTPAGSTISSSAGYRYFQYRTIMTSSDYNVSPSLTSATVDYVANSPPSTPSLDLPTNGASSQALLPTLKTTTTDPDGNYLRYKIVLCTDSAMTQNCQTFDQTSSQTGWSGQNAQTSTAYTSGTQGVYTLQTPLSPATIYYWDSYAIDPGGTNTWSSTQAAPYYFTTNRPPLAPTLDAPLSGVGTSTFPTFQTTATDPDSDYLRYKILVCTDKYMLTGCQTFDQTSSQTGWSGQNTQTSTAYTSGTQATYTIQSALSANTSYFWQSYAIDPGGSNTWSPTTTAIGFITNSPSTPTLLVPGNPTTSVSLLPALQLVALDNQGNYLRYKIQICTDLAMTVACQTFDQTASQTGWSGQNTQTNTAYTSGTTATYTFSTPLAVNTGYYWRGYSIAPGGANVWSSPSNIFSFTTAATPPPATGCILHESRSDSSLQIAWANNAIGNTGYEIRRALDGGAFSVLVTGLSPTATSYTDTTMTEGHAYQYEVAPYYTGPVYGSWCLTTKLTLSLGNFKFQNIKFQ